VTTVNTVPSDTARLGIVHDSNGKISLGRRKPRRRPVDRGVSESRHADKPGSWARRDFVSINLSASTPCNIPHSLRLSIRPPTGHCSRMAIRESFRFFRAGSDHRKYFTVRLDHKFSDSDSIYVTYMRDNSKTIQPRTFGQLFLRYRVRPAGRNSS